MATKRRTIKSRGESISARKRRNRTNPLQAELDKPLAKSFKEGVGAAATIAGPGKFLRPLKKLRKKAVVVRSAKSKRKNPLRATITDVGSGKVTRVGPRGLTAKQKAELRLKNGSTFK